MKVTTEETESLIEDGKRLRKFETALKEWRSAEITIKHSGLDDKDWVFITMGDRIWGSMGTSQHTLAETIDHLLPEPDNGL